MTNPGQLIDAPQSMSSDSAIIAPTGDGLSVSLAPRGMRSDGLPLSIWLCGWLVGEILVGRIVLRDGGHIDFHSPAILLAFPAVWLAIWTIVGYYVVSRWLFAFWGHRELTTDTRSISLRMTMFGQGRTQVFDLQRVQNVRAMPDADYVRHVAALNQTTRIREQIVNSEVSDAVRAEVEQALARQTSRVERLEREPIWSIAFDFGGKTYRFGESLSRATCQTIQVAIERSQIA